LKGTWSSYSAQFLSGLQMKNAGTHSFIKTLFTGHIERTSTDALREMFMDRIICSGLWPAYPLLPPSTCVTFMGNHRTKSS